MILAALTSITIALSWSANPARDGVAFYRVYRGEQIVASTTATVFAENIARGQEHEWVVTAVDSSGNESLPSDAVVFFRPLVLHLPLATVADGVAACRPGGTLYVFAGNTAWTGKVSKPMKIKALGGSVRIGG